MSVEKEPEEKLFSVKEKRYYLRLIITIISLLFGAVIFFYAISPLQTCLYQNFSKAFCHEAHSW